MAYFIKNSDGNFDYSYYGVNDTILGEYVDPGRIQAYLDDETFQQAVVNSYASIDLSGDNEKDVARVLAKMERTADWLRKKANGFYF